MDRIFSISQINGMSLRNRFVRSATWEGMCLDDGRPTEKLAHLYRRLAAGGVGLIISGYAFVAPEGKQMPGKMGICSGAFAQEMKALTRAVHDEGGAVCMQLVHAGGQASRKLTGLPPLAPSAIENPYYTEVPSEMTTGDVERVVECFGAGAARAKEYGFDAVQIHGAHGYLVSQFLSPLTNRRSDRYGGTASGRRRFLVECCRSVRAAVGNNFPLLVKVNCSDFLEGGLDTSEGVAAAAAAVEAGADAVEVSGGTPASGRKSPARTKIRSEEQEAYHLPYAALFKSRLACPVMVVGGVRSLTVAAEAVEQDRADYISIARPLIREPDLVGRWKRGEHSKARCISCNGCFKPGLREGGIYCVVERKEEKKRRGDD